VSHAVIKVVDLWKYYDEEGHGGNAALRGTSLEVRRGEVLAIFGKSGSGKSTLLNLIAGLDRPTRGLIEIEGKNLETLGEAGRTELRRTRLGFVFQFFNLIPTLTALENVHLSLELAGISNLQIAGEALAGVSLHGKERRYPHELSGGEQQRVAIARALVKDPALVLADEPTGNLDTMTGNQILKILTSRCRQTGMTLVMVTHTSLACHYADRILTMVDGIITDKLNSEEI
jgi:putative ABC transport system ATP-binding protein